MVTFVYLNISIDQQEGCTAVNVHPFTIIVHWFQGVLHLTYKQMLIHSPSNTNTMFPILHKNINNNHKMASMCIK